MIEIEFYTTDSGKQPFVEWMGDLDFTIKAIVMKRIARLRVNNYGECKTIKGSSGISELIIDYGPGYRIYYAKKHLSLVVLLVGGNKRSQERDIIKAKKYWQAYQEK